MQRLLAEVPLEERSIFLFGRAVLQPRLVGWAGDRPYTYSRQTLEPRPMGPCLTALLELTDQVSGYRFNHALVNLYRDGSDSMGMHSDDEPELGELPVVASWSFGAERPFVIAAKRGSERRRILLPPGSLLVMEGETQRHFRHGLPKSRGVTTPRLNVTFRLVACG
jgi:alkylated DNA repair dioxygenase AlkB